MNFIKSKWKVGDSRHTAAIANTSFLVVSVKKCVLLDVCTWYSYHRIVKLLFNLTSDSDLIDDLLFM